MADSTSVSVPPVSNVVVIHTSPNRGTSSDRRKSQNLPALAFDNISIPSKVGAVASNSINPLAKDMTQNNPTDDPKKESSHARKVSFSFKYDQGHHRNASNGTNAGSGGGHHRTHSSSRSHRPPQTPSHNSHLRAHVHLRDLSIEIEPQIHVANIEVEVIGEEKQKPISPINSWDPKSIEAEEKKLQIQYLEEMDLKALPLHEPYFHSIDDRLVDGAYEFKEDVSTNRKRRGSIQHNEMKDGKENGQINGNGHGNESDADLVDRRDIAQSDEWQKWYSGYKKILLRRKNRWQRLDRDLTKIKLGLATEAEKLQQQKPASKLQINESDIHHPDILHCVSKFCDSTSNTAKKLIRKGISPQYRPLVWKTLLLRGFNFKEGTMNIKTDKEEDPFTGKARNERKEFYLKLISKESLAKVIASPSAKTIEKDIDRTYTNHPYFRPTLRRKMTRQPQGQNDTQQSDDTVSEEELRRPVSIRQLKRILLAYAAYKPAIGYCQSLNYLCAMFLLFYDEIDSFFLFAATLARLPQDYYSETLAGVIVDIRSLRNEFFPQLLPKLHQAFNTLPIPVDLTGFLAPWFLCLFLKSLPFESCLRIFDCFVFEGEKVLFRVSLQLFVNAQKRLIQLCDSAVTNDDPSAVFSFLNCIGHGEKDVEQLLKKAFAIRLKRKWIESARKQERIKVEKEMEDLKRRRETRQKEKAHARMEREEKTAAGNGPSSNK